MAPYSNIKYLCGNVGSVSATQQGLLGIAAAIAQPFFQQSFSQKLRYRTQADVFQCQEAFARFPAAQDVHLPTTVTCGQVIETEQKLIHV